MKHLFTFLLIGFATVALAQNKPVLNFEKESHSFGKIPQGKPVNYEFIFTNNGDAPLILKNVKASCGCTTPYYPTEPIQPGATSKIKVVYNASRPGNFHKSVRIVTNEKKVDGSDKTTVLFIKGEVISDSLKPASPPKSPVKIEN